MNKQYYYLEASSVVLISGLIAIVICMCAGWNIDINGWIFIGTMMLSGVLPLLFYIRNKKQKCDSK